MVSSWSAHGQHMVSSWSDHGQIMVSSWSAYGQLMVGSWSAHGRIMVRANEKLSDILSSGYVWENIKLYDISSWQVTDGFFMRSQTWFTSFWAALYYKKANMLSWLHGQGKTFVYPVKQICLRKYETLQHIFSTGYRLFFHEVSDVIYKCLDSDLLQKRKHVVTTPHPRKNFQISHRADMSEIISNSMTYLLDRVWIAFSWGLRHDLQVFRHCFT
jgi:hypothetical protein